MYVHIKFPEQFYLWSMQSDYIYFKVKKTKAQGNQFLVQGCKVYK